MKKFWFLFALALVIGGFPMFTNAVEPDDTCNALASELTTFFTADTSAFYTECLSDTDSVRTNLQAYGDRWPVYALLNLMGADYTDLKDLLVDSNFAILISKRSLIWPQQATFQNLIADFTIAGVADFLNNPSNATFITAIFAGTPGDTLIEKNYGLITDVIKANNDADPLNNIDEGAIAFLLWLPQVQDVIDAIDYITAKDPALWREAFTRLVAEIVNGNITNLWGIQIFLTIEYYSVPAPADATNYQQAAAYLINTAGAIHNAIVSGVFVLYWNNEPANLVSARITAINQLNSLNSASDVTNLIGLANAYKNLASYYGVEIASTHKSSNYDKVVEFFDLADRMDDNRTAGANLSGRADYEAANAIYGTIIQDFVNGAWSDIWAAEYDKYIEAVKAIKKTLVPPYYGWGWGGWGGSSLQMDVCPNGDTSPSFYDGKCGETVLSWEIVQNTGNNNLISNQTGNNSGTNVISASIDGSTYSDEQNQAYLWAFKNWITTTSNIIDAKLDTKVTRAQLAKMISQFAIKVMWKTPNTSKDCSAFLPSIKKYQGQDLYDFMITSCQLDLMWIDLNGGVLSNFMPDKYVTRWEFWTVLSRVLYGTTYNNYTTAKDFYTEHLKALKDAGIITNTTPSLEELRGYIMLMMYRASQSS